MPARTLQEYCNVEQRLIALKCLNADTHSSILWIGRIDLGLFQQLARR